MIACDLHELAHQAKLSPAMQEGLDFLRGLSSDNLSLPEDAGPGGVAFDIADGHVHVLIREYQGTPGPHNFEGHKGVVEFQYVVSGQMNIDWTPAERIIITRPWSAESDMWVGTAPEDVVSETLLKAGQVAVYWPEDAHALSATPPGESALKVALKIDLGW